MRHKIGPLGLLAAALLQAACTDSKDAQAPQPPSGVPNFTTEDKRVARALSVGTGSLVQASPEGRAVLCTLALETVRPQMQASGALSGPQRQAFAQAIEVFRDRAARGYGDPGKLAEARRRAEIDYPGAGDRAKMAVACLRSFA